MNNKITIHNQLCNDYQSTMNIFFDDYQKIKLSMLQDKNLELRKTATKLIIQVLDLILTFEKKPLSIYNLQQSLVNTRKAFYSWIKIL